MKKSGEVMIERLRPEDEPEAVEMIRRNLSDYAEAGSVLAATNRRLRSLYEIHNHEAAIFLVVRASSKPAKIIGGAGLGPLAGLPVSEGVAEIRDLVIEKSFRGQGLGKRLLEQVLDQARTIGYKRVYLETTPQMVQAHNLFRNFGFKPVEQKGQLSSNKNGEPLPAYFHLEKL